MCRDKALLSHHCQPPSPQAKFLHKLHRIKLGTRSNSHRELVDAAHGSSRAHTHGNVPLNVVLYMFPNYYVYIVQNPKTEKKTTTQ